MTTTALFTNFSSKEFIGYWDGKAKKFAAGQSLYMPDYLAKHFAKHLANRELIEIGLERLTSPKNPEQVPEFMDMFNKAFTPDQSDEFGETKKPDVDTLIDVVNKNRQERAEMKVSDPDKQDPTQPQVVLSPDFDGNDDEESFEAKPIE